MGRPQLFDLDENGEPKDPQVEDNQEVAESTEDTEALQEGQPQPETENVTEEAELPEKYRGKSAAEIAKMHMEVERRLGTQGGEVGALKTQLNELQGFFDNYVQSQTVAQDKEETTEDVDFYVDPEAAVNRAIDNHPKVQKAEQVTAQMNQAAATNALQRLHPDYLQVAADPAFQSWVAEKPALVQMFQRADQMFDVEAGDTLLSLWKERKTTADTAAQMDKDARDAKARQASTGKVTGSPEGAPRRKKFRRSDIIKLMQTDPDRYDAMQPEIMAAYANGDII